MSHSIREEQVPLGGKIACMFVSLVGLSIIAICTLRRVQAVKISTQLPLTFFLVVAIYSSSFLFVFLTAVYRDVGINESHSLCDGAIILCLTLYIITKLCIYLFLVERVHIVRGSRTPRTKDTLYMINVVGMFIPYVAIFALNVVFRFAYFDDKGVCVVGVRRPGLVPLISFDVAVNAYLTVLFLVALRRLYSYREGQCTTLRNVGLRSSIGAGMTLIVTIVNLTVLVLMDGEPSWICFMSCSLDVIFGVTVIHWITKTDRTQLSPYYRQTQAVPPQLWFKPPYASNESDDSPGNDSTKREPTTQRPDHGLDQAT
ncbi:hypothetical protein B0J12DRAFT_735607 [Macrophomina phaseolina]|uniref:Uncharacterized protein n=1 Tax=Macrophomina phaseolina TaxID=35725 RepID=A0ABQ8GTT6_9PEZI|nr:hypothetical protein B0J12DRAFT_735607 [Macrophomina phaseolina]